MSNQILFTKKLKHLDDAEIMFVVTGPTAVRITVKNKAGDEQDLVPHQAAVLLAMNVP